MDVELTESRYQHYKGVCITYAVETGGGPWPPTFNGQYLQKDQDTLIEQSATQSITPIEVIF